MGDLAIVLSVNPAFSSSFIIRWFSVFAKKVNISSKECLNSQISLLVHSTAFPSCSDKLPLPLPLLCTRCPDLEPDSLWASRRRRQPTLTYLLPQKPSYEQL